MGIWVDTDMSGDDVFALHLLVRHAQVDGISLGFGVVPLPQVRANAAGACAAFGWSAPLHAGADRAVLGGLETAERILGPTGIRSRGGMLPAAEDRARSDALRALAAWLEGREAAEILALGPLTNLAVLALARPDLLPRIARITWMGGGVTSGNHTASAEFNAFADPEALAIVLSRGAPIRMIDLDACRRVQIDETDVAALGPGLLADLLGGYLDIALERGRPSMALYDPVAAAAHLRPDLFRFRSVRLDAELGGLHARGRTIVETRHAETHNAEIAEDLDAEAVKRLCLSALRPSP
ncbi:MAG: nucleoside hydrolase [Pseudomonadota bacterium]